MTKYAMVTGASTGIGRGTVKVLTGEGFHVFGSVRKEADADSLKQEFGDKVTPVVFDVTDEAGVRAGAAFVKEQLKGATLDGLVNNAGIAVAGPWMHLPIEEFRHQLEVNTISILTVTQAFLPLLGATNPPPARPGRIVNISSLGGKNGSPFLGPYNASKFAVEGMTESMRREFQIYGIDAIVIGPGAIATPIWDKAEELPIAPYEGTDFIEPLKKTRDYMTEMGPKGLPPEAVGTAVLKALTAAKPKVRYAVLPSPMEVFIQSVLPKRRVDKIIAKRLGLTRLGS